MQQHSHINSQFPSISDRQQTVSFSCREQVENHLHETANKFRPEGSLLLSTAWKEELRGIKK